MTLQPVSQNFFVEIKDEWDRRGTIWEPWDVEVAHVRGLDALAIW